MNYEQSMAGLDQVFEALFAQQQQPVQIEVDEMQDQNAQGGMNDLMQQLKAIGQDTSASSIDIMNRNLATTEKEDDGGGGIMDFLGSLFG